MIAGRTFSLFLLVGILSGCSTTTIAQSGHLGYDRVNLPRFQQGTDPARDSFFLSTKGTFVNNREAGANRVLFLQTEIDWVQPWVLVPDRLFVTITLGVGGFLGNAICNNFPNPVETGSAINGPIETHPFWGTRAHYSPTLGVIFWDDFQGFLGFDSAVSYEGGGFANRRKNQKVVNLYPNDSYTKERDFYNLSGSGFSQSHLAFLQGDYRLSPQLLLSVGGGFGYILPELTNVHMIDDQIEAYFAFSWDRHATGLTLDVLSTQMTTLHDANTQRFYLNAGVSWFYILRLS